MKTWDWVGIAFVIAVAGCAIEGVVHALRHEPDTASGCNCGTRVEVRQCADGGVP